MFSYLPLTSYLLEEKEEKEETRTSRIESRKTIMKFGEVATEEKNLSLRFLDFQVMEPSDQAPVEDSKSIVINQKQRCRFIYPKNSCHFGNQCKRSQCSFLHPGNPEYYSQRYPTPHNVCHFFQNGNCRFGDKCRFAHYKYTMKRTSSSHWNIQFLLNLPIDTLIYLTSFLFQEEFILFDFALLTSHLLSEKWMKTNIRIHIYAVNYHHSKNKIISKFKFKEEHTGPIHCLIQLPNGKFASGSQDKTIKIWNLSSFISEKTLIGHTDGILSLLSIQTEENRIVSGSKDRTFRIWNIFTGDCTRILTDDHHHPYHQSTSSSSPMIDYSLIQLDKDHFLSKSMDSEHGIQISLKVWNLETGNCELTVKNAFDFLLQKQQQQQKQESNNLFSIHEKMIQSILERPRKSMQLMDGRLAYLRYPIEIWNLHDNKCESSYNSSSCRISCFQQFPIDGRLVCAGKSESKVYERRSLNPPFPIIIWNLDGSDGIYYEEILRGGHTKPVNCLLPLEDGSLISGSDDRTIIVWRPLQYSL